MNASSKLTRVAVGLACWSALLLGCGPVNDDTAIKQGAALGDRLPGLVAGADLLAEAEAAFATVEQITDGVGPIFNERACGNCHSEGARGGAGVNIERRFGRFSPAGFFDPLAARGGTLRQLFSVGNFNNPALPAGSRGRCQAGNPTLCCVPVEVEPPEATVRNVGRLTTPLFGLGLVDTIPDAFFDGLAAAQPAAIRGVVNRVPVILPNPGDPSQGIRTTRVGRFGWKAGISTLIQFSADAYNNEMGISTQSCFRGTSLNDFALENPPNALPGTEIDGCDDLAPRQAGNPPTPAVPAITAAQWHQVDDAVGSCAGNLTLIQDDVFLFTVFMTSLAPPPRDTSDQSAVNQGSPVFDRVGCGGCHVRTTFRTPANPPRVDIGNGQETIRVPGNFPFNPFSDFLAHDMGALGDRIGNAPPDDPATGLGDDLATTRRMRTAPLWGLRFRNRLLHDGRASDVATAVRQHDGQAAAARNAFNALNATDQHNLVQFVRSL